MTSIRIFTTAALLILANVTVVDAAECSWGAPETADIEPSVPQGVSTASKEIAIGQPVNLVIAEMQRDFSSNVALQTHV
jgi:hypothetical protein